MNPVLRVGTALVTTLLLADAAGQCAHDDATCSAATASHSLLQRRNSLERSGYAPRQDPSLVGESVHGVAASASDLTTFGAGADFLQESLVYPDASDPHCKLGGSCATTMIPQMRSVCVRNAHDAPECWDVCNTTHAIEDFTTGNNAIDARVRASVKDIRAGSYSYVKCPGNMTSKTGDNSTDWEAIAAAKMKEAQMKEQVAKRAREAAKAAGSSGNQSESSPEASKSNGKVSNAEAEAIAADAALDTVGFKEVQRTRNHDAMESFIRRVVRESLGCRVADEDKLEAYGLYYSVEKSANFRTLEGELYKACTTKSIPWLTPMFGGDTAASATATNPNNFQYNEEGYQSVAAQRDHFLMNQYVRGVVSLLGGAVVDDAGLEGMISYYSGEKATQTFQNLVNELRVIMSSPDGWVVNMAQTSMSQSGNGAMAGGGNSKTNGFRRGPAQAARNRTDHFLDCPTNETADAHNKTAWALPLNETGYQALVNLKEHHDCAMMHYIRRLINKIGCKVIDESGLRGMIPFYSGGKNKQSFNDLMNELRGSCTTSSRWLSPVNSTSNTTGKSGLALLAEMPILERLEQLEGELRHFEKAELLDLEERASSP